MSQEWTNWYNPFNSLKALYWSHQLEAMARGETPVPVCVTIDPTNLCQLDCAWCIMRDLRNKNKVAIPDDILLQLPEFLSWWGAKSVCVGGGGEPFCHPKVGELLRRLKASNLAVGTITNGLAVNYDEVRYAIVDSCRWIGFSVDAATTETYNKIKRPADKNAFEKVCENIKWICDHRKAPKRPQIGMKFLWHKMNFDEIVDFVELAKSLGADDVHFRPVADTGCKFSEVMIDKIGFLIAAARAEFEDERFRVYGIVHKFDKHFRRAIRFKRCMATPINAYFLADGTLALCCDRREDQSLNLGTYYPFSNVMEKWGSAEHKAMLEKINPQLCPRCTQAITNEIIERVIINDEMCHAFV